MKRMLLVLVLFATTIAQSQEKTFEKEVHKISKRIENITTKQKDSLKVKVVNIDKRLDKGEITKTTAETLKQEVAAYHARRIETLVSEQERLLQLLVQDKTNGKIASSNELYFNDDDINTFTVGHKTFRFSINDEDNDHLNTEKHPEDKKKDRGLGNRTTSQFVFALGVNNVLDNNDFSSLNNSEYQFWRSRFYEVGFTWKTSITKRPSQLYFKYGVSFLWNNLRPENNQFHLKNDKVTELQDFPENLSESRLRHVQMNFPMHLEWDLSKNSVFKDGGISDRTNQAVRLGVGGFVGFKLGTRQYLEFDDANNIDIEEVQYDNFNMNTVNYGLSAYVGYKATSLYLKYDLNPLFKNTETRNISMGVRFDLN
ncbi:MULTISPECIES: hypothetical protein [unclassified Polaribacter]|uniref:hypothetical protein n=1 Tax=unclassified Polaribacter TaxID=196858 RepID=UPI0011BE9F30|nr:MULTISPECIES: hypothetical protein [unclassified Polaribacter]TXD50806.1 hypothetical protein ES043_14670 [Polaribacter sp. IC063]TXD57538.1 hypothetical protein ES044_14805 [Polaribacter sp. IC066]